MITQSVNGYLATREWLFAYGKMVISASRKVKGKFPRVARKLLIQKPKASGWKPSDFDYSLIFTFYEEK